MIYQFRNRLRPRVSVCAKEQENGSIQRTNFIITTNNNICNINRIYLQIALQSVISLLLIMETASKKKRESSPQPIPEDSSGGSCGTPSVRSGPPSIRNGSWKVLSSQHYEGLCKSF